MQNLFFTSDMENLFCIFDTWSSSIQLDLLETERVEKINLLGWEGAINWTVEDHRLTIQIPNVTMDEIPCLFAWTLQIELN